ncbi:hypothetical protein POPTR_012G053600v4 [Populus trichocarpa]|uniref:Glycosyltransferase family 28 N-terminal domain-containing protein n=1 Tax=Populus trichocarpa TaxID=3694 RepID=B9I2J0_POPTR|nr:uncharacterized protein LOC7486753 isoform X1 [Populus trichocarpa]PNT09593.1 hypothetical protein POPTR_012G053600v4 [Populus trichocarpa]|eukprot:XP_002317900.2 uncharacterized protein LOC7486753 isoform X1 [Populus trichocarpa]
MATIPHHHLHQLAFIPSCPSSSSSSSSPSLLSLSTKHRSFKILCCLSIKESTNDHQITPQEPRTPTKNNLRVVLAAGGTGGHIIPAVAIADELRVSNPNIEILFIGTPNSMESTSIPSAGYPFTSIPPVKLFRPLVSLENLTLPIHLIHSIIHSFKLLKEFDPHVVIGTGGYVSFPTCLAALLQRTKIVIHEQNSVPGIANYVLSYFSHLVFLSYNSTIECFPKKHNCVVTGNPVRVSLRQFVSRAVARLEFFPMAGEEAKVILVLGGSLGANAINIALLNVYSQMLLEHKDWYIIWQTGVESYNEMESLVRNHSNLVLKPFLHSMDLAYAAADLIVSRAGAMTCSEILATGKSAILIPSPDVAEGHQFKNASLMADVAGTRVITEDELDSTTLGTAIEEILDDDALRAEMSERALRAAKPDASAQIAQHILSLVESSTKRK